MKKKSKKKKSGKKIALVFPEDGSFLNKDEIDDRVKPLFKVDFKILTKDGKIRF